MKTADKTDKAAVKPAIKVFDISHPGKTAPSASARPVIVTNRPIMQDPMVAPGAEQALPSKPLRKITLQPLDETEKAAVQADDQQKAEEPANTEKPETAKIEVAASSEEPGEVAATEVAVEPEEQPKETTESPEEKPEDTNPKTEESDQSEQTSNQNPDGTPLEDGKNDKAQAAETAELEAKAKQEEAINELVESREYMLPINAVERHRSKVISILGLILIILLGLVLLDLLMDVGTLKVPGAHPVTHFFSAWNR